MSYKITDEQKNRVKMSSIFALPTSPSERGMKPDAIKEAFWKPFSILIELINNCFDETVKLASSKPTVWIEQNFGLAVGMVMYCYKELKFGDIILISEAGVPDFIIIKAEKPYVDEETIHITEEEVCNNQLPVPKPGEIYRIGNTELALLGVESGIASVEYDEKVDKNSTNAIQNKAVAELAEQIQSQFENTKTLINKTYCTIEDFKQAQEKIGEIESIAKGANQAICFDNYTAMVEHFRNAPAHAYNNGQNIMIVDLYVPDLWVSMAFDEDHYYEFEDYRIDSLAKDVVDSGFIYIGHYRISALETQKVDLTDYATLEDLENYAQHVDDRLKSFEQYADSKYATLEQVGDIETALDTIIAIQNSLIGGDSV